MEYRVCWSAGSNITFRGATDWAEWDGDESTDAEIAENLGGRGGGVSDGLEMALEGSGFEWWTETR